MARMLYFAKLADVLGSTAEEVTLPATVSDVRSLLGWLRMRGGVWQQALQERAVRVTVNRQFADLDTSVSDSDEVGLINTRG